MSSVSRQDIQALIIEDSARFRGSLKQMLQQFGIVHIEDEANGEAGVERLRLRPYDLILCDYELGDGKDGREVLEEIRHAELLPPSALFIMVTAAQSMEMVMGALEAEPDAYLAKPITFELLQTRLERCIRRKAMFERVHQALENADYDRALRECDKLIDSEPKYALQAQRIKGSLLIDLAYYDWARQLYQAVLAERQLPWAQLGLAKALALAGDYAAAKPRFTEMVETDRRHVEALDWLARLQQHDGELSEAQETLEMAANQSPKSVPRQARLGELAETNEDWEVAVRAYRRAVSLSEHSFHHSPEHYLGLARALGASLTGEHGAYARGTAKEAFRALSHMRQQYPEDASAHVRALVIEARINFGLGSSEDGERSLVSARGHYRELGDAPEEGVTLALAELLVDHSDDEDARGFLDWLAREARADEAAIEALRERLEAAATARENARIENLNNRAVALYEQGKVEKAVAIFVKGAEAPQASYAILLNTVQALLKLAEHQKGRAQRKTLQQSAQFLRALSDLPEDDGRRERYERLVAIQQSMK